MSRRHRRAAAAVALLLALAPRLAAAQGFREHYMTASASISPAEPPAGGAFELEVRLEVDPAVHVYKHTLQFTWQETKGAKVVKVVKPSGTLYPDLTTPEEGDTTEAYEGSATLTVRCRATGQEGEPILLRGSLAYQGCTENMCRAPKDLSVSAEATTGPAAEGAPAGEGGEEGPAPEGQAEEAPPESSAQEVAGRLEEKGILGFVALTFVLGLALSLTPCAYPLIPITVAIIGAKEKRSKLASVGLAALYVLGISITYAVLGVLVASLGASVRMAFQSPWFLVPIGALFVVLALAMFDVVTIQMPGSVGGLAEKLRGRGGLVGVVLLGAASGLVAGPCVAAPLLGVLVAVAKRADRLLGALSMFTLAWGMGAILLVAGASTGLLPKAGAWMEWVKRLFGFVLLWAAVYFLRPVIGEVAFHLGTAAVLLAGAVFLGGFDALTPESGFAARAKRLLGLVALFAAVAFALMGLGATGSLPLAASTQEKGDPFTFADAERVDEALASGQPVVLDFTAEWCTYCAELDRTTFSDPAVVAELGRFQAFKVDVTESPELVERYEVAGPPLIAVHDSQGDLVRKLGYEDAKDPQQFLQFLKTVE
ncbi:MAG: cytochrome c biogenesis protein CcdA [Candidatus Brocadiia bacterium]